MQPSKTNLMSIFERSRCYLVPIFQRPYVWSEEGQWKYLWEDISEKADTIYHKDPIDRTPIRSHFLGAIVLSFVDASRFNPHVPSDDIIDGQQRLTTIQLILIALRDIVKKYPSGKLPDVLTNLTFNHLAQIPNEELKVWPSISDRKVFKGVFEAGGPEEIEKRFPMQRYYRSRYYMPRPRIADAYLYFHKQTLEYIAQDGNGNGQPVKLGDTLTTTQQKRLESIIDAVTKYVEIVTIELEVNDDPQVIFEALNDHREPLLPSDLIRNFVFLNAQANGKSVEDIHKKYWADYDDYEHGDASFWKTQEGRGKRINQRFDLFAFYWLVAQTRKEILLANVYQEFREWWSLDPSREVEDALGDLQAFATLFKKLYRHEDGTYLGAFTRRLRELDTTTVYPLVLWLLSLKEKSLQPAEREKIFRYLESFLVRRAVCGLTGKNYNRFFLSLLRSAAKETTLTADWFYQYLDGQTEPTARWPNDAEFRQAWLSRPVYESGAALPRLVLKAINMQMDSKYDLDVKTKGEPSVEHIMPRNLNATGWAISFPSGTDEGTKAKAIERRRTIIHTLGNLTLVTSPFNSSLQDDNFAKKRAAYLDHIGIKLNTFFAKLKDGDPWTEASIEIRGKELFDCALQIWIR